MLVPEQRESSAASPNAGGGRSFCAQQHHMRVFKFVVSCLAVFRTRPCLLPYVIRFVGALSLSLSLSLSLCFSTGLYTTVCNFVVRELLFQVRKYTAWLSSRFTREKEREAKLNCKLTPVAHAATLVGIAWLYPGKAAVAFRRQGAESCLAMT